MQVHQRNQEVITDQVSWFKKNRYLLVFHHWPSTCGIVICQIICAKASNKHNRFMVLHLVPRTAQNQILALILLFSSVFMTFPKLTKGLSGLSPASYLQKKVVALGFQYFLYFPRTNSNVIHWMSCVQDLWQRLNLGMCWSLLLPTSIYSYTHSHFRMTEIL